MIRHAQPNQLCLRTYNTISLTIFAALSPDSDSQVTTWISSGFLKQRSVPYELWVCTKCNWHCVQDQEYVLPDCPSAGLANLRVKHHHLFCTPSSSSNRLRDFVSHADAKVVRAWVPGMLHSVPRFQNPTLLAFCWFWLQTCLASAKLPSFSRYSYVTWPVPRFQSTP